MATVVLDRKDAVAAAVHAFENGLDFADAMHLATTAGHATEFITFDRHFVRLAEAQALAPPVRLLL
jgi:predicted nucleic acid-binding protein